MISGHGGAVERWRTTPSWLPSASPSPTRATRSARSAAADLRAAVERLNADAEDGTSLDLRIGIATGEVLAAGGSGGGQPHATGGSPIGVAAALEQAADAGEVVIGPLTQRLVHTTTTTSALGELTLPAPTEAHRGVPPPRCLEALEQPTFGTCSTRRWSGGSVAWAARRRVLCASPAPRGQLPGRVPA